MNRELLDLLHSPLTEENRKEILHIINEASPEESELNAFVTDIRIVTKIANIAAGYVDTATAKLSQEDPRWEILLGTTEISNALAELLKNPSIINYTQAVVLVTAALLKEGRYANDS
jgi:uncharacterized protein with von Willebrand factor type A (vWA) domain